MVISMALDHPPQISNLMAQNRILMTKTKHTSNIVIIIRRMISRVVVTMRMWVTCLGRTRKRGVEVTHTASENTLDPDFSEVAKRC